MDLPRLIARLAAALSSAVTPALADDFRSFTTKGLPRSTGVAIQVSHPAAWREAPADDAMALAELRGPQGNGLSGIVQIGRGRQRDDMDTLCRPERARTMLGNLAGDARVTDVHAGEREGRPAFEIRYERQDAAGFMAVRSVIICLKDSQVLVSCAGAAETKQALARIDPVCRRVLDSLAIREE